MKRSSLFVLIAAFTPIAAFLPIASSGLAQTPPPKAPPKGKRPSSGMPSRWVLLRGLLDGEIGSLWEGPDVGEMAPDFTLPTHDGTRALSLRQFRGKKPVVLVFGSFT